MLCLAIATLFAQQAQASLDEAPTVEGILRQHIEAIGGLRAWSKIESIRIAGTVSQNRQDADILIIKKRPNQIRATVTIPIPGEEDKKFQVIRAHDGSTAWTASRQAGARKLKTSTLSQSEAQTLLNDAQILPPLFRLWQEGAQLELNGVQNIKGKDYFVIKAQVKGSADTFTFNISTESLLTHRYTTEISGVTWTTTLTNYEKQGEVMMPTTSIIESKASGVSIVTAETIELGVGIYDEYFKPIDSIRTANY